MSKLSSQFTSASCPFTSLFEVPQFQPREFCSLPLSSRFFPIDPLYRSKFGLILYWRLFWGLARVTFQYWIAVTGTSFFVRVNPFQSRLTQAGDLSFPRLSSILTLGLLFQGKPYLNLRWLARLFQGEAQRLRLHAWLAQPLTRFFARCQPLSKYGFASCQLTLSKAVEACFRSRRNCNALRQPSSFFTTRSVRWREFS